jgi:hypothetical protein
MGSARAAVMWRRHRNGGGGGDADDERRLPELAQARPCTWTRAGRSVGQMHTDKSREERRPDYFNHVVSSEWAASGLKVNEW